MGTLGYRKKLLRETWEPSALNRMEGQIGNGQFEVTKCLRQVRGSGIITEL